MLILSTLALLEWNSGFRV
jgi:hypothetical protein